MDNDAYHSLRPKDRRLVDEYLSNGLVQWAAYRDCFARKKTREKYDTLRVESSKYFANPNIQAAIAARLEAVAMSKEEALHRLAEQGRNEQMQYLNEDGSIDLERLIADGKAHLIKGVKFVGKDADRMLVEFYDAQTALDKIVRAGGGYVDRVEHSGPSGGPVPVAVDDFETAFAFLDQWRPSDDDR